MSKNVLMVYSKSNSSREGLAAAPVAKDSGKNLYTFQ